MNENKTIKVNPLGAEPVGSLLKRFGGTSIPLACVGIISKVNQMFFSFIIGISQGL